MLCNSLENNSSNSPCAIYFQYYAVNTKYNVKRKPTWNWGSSRVCWLYWYQFLCHWRQYRSLDTSAQKMASCPQPQRLTADLGSFDIDSRCQEIKGDSCCHFRFLRHVFSILLLPGNWKIIALQIVKPLFTLRRTGIWSTANNMACSSVCAIRTLASTHDATKPFFS